jgi:hypothetical protein
LIRRPRETGSEDCGRLTGYSAEKFSSARISSNAKTSGDWNAFTPDRLKTELDQGHAIFIDFTAA